MTASDEYDSQRGCLGDGLLVTVGWCVGYFGLALPAVSLGRVDLLNLPGRIGLDLVALTFLGPLVALIAVPVAAAVALTVRGTHRRNDWPWPPDLTLAAVGGACGLATLVGLIVLSGP